MRKVYFVDGSPKTVRKLIEDAFKNETVIGEKIAEFVNSASATFKDKGLSASFTWKENLEGKTEVSISGFKSEVIDSVYDLVFGAPIIKAKAEDEAKAKAKAEAEAKAKAEAEAKAKAEAEAKAKAEAEAKAKAEAEAKAKAEAEAKAKAEAEAKAKAEAEKEVSCFEEVEIPAKAEPVEQAQEEEPKVKKLFGRKKKNKKDLMK